MNKSLLARLVAFLALLALSIANFALAQVNFPSVSIPTDEKGIDSLGLFKVTVYSKFWPMFDGTHGSPYYGYGVSSHKFTSPLLADNATWIGLSAAHCQNPSDPALKNAIPGVSCSPTFAPTPTASYSEITAVPPGFPSGQYNEVFVDMINMQLTAFSNCATAGVTQVPKPYDLIDPMVVAGPQFHPSLPKSIGQMVGGEPSVCSGSVANYTIPPAPAGYFDLSSALPGNSYFDIYANIFIPNGTGTDVPFAGFTLYNSPNDALYGPQPLIVQNTAVDGLPPSAIYLHSGYTVPVLVRFASAGQDISGTIKWTNGEPFGSLMLSGHVLNYTCGTSHTSDFVDAVLGPADLGNPEPPILWTFANNLFPSQGITYNSEPGTNFGGGSVSVIAFSNTLNGTVILRSIMQGTFTAPISPPALGTQSVYSDASSSFACEASLDDTNFSAVSGFGQLQYAISNMGPSGIGTLYNLTAINQTNSVGLSPFGPFLLRASLTKPSTGHHFIVKSSNVASYLDMTYEYSDDAGATWYPANRSIRLDVSEPACGVAGQYVSIATNSSGDLVFSWPSTNYTLQGTTNITTPNWVNFPGTPPLTLGKLTNGCEFYRVVCIP